MMSLPILQVESLTKAFQSDQGDPFLAVANISFTVAAGEFLGLVGPSGCGKTTLLHLLAGLVTPSKGQVWVMGEPLTQPHPEIGVVFQKPNLMPWRTVLDNIMLPLQIQAIPRNEALQRSEEVLALDALTRERLNMELLRLWQTQNLTALMVTHDIREAVFLADRVLVLSQRPATLAAEFTVDLPRPRPKGIEFSQTFGQLAYEIRQAIKD